MNSCTCFEESFLSSILDLYLPFRTFTAFMTFSFFKITCSPSLIIFAERDSWQRSQNVKSYKLQKKAAILKSDNALFTLQCSVLQKITADIHVTVELRGRSQFRYPHTSKMAVASFSFKNLWYYSVIHSSVVKLNRAHGIIKLE